MHCSIQEGCSTVHTSWNASPEESEIPSISSPSCFWFSTFSTKKRTKALLCLKSGHKKNYLKGASEHLVHEHVLFLQGHGKLSQ